MNPDEDTFDEYDDEYDEELDDVFPDTTEDEYLEEESIVKEQTETPSGFVSDLLKDPWPRVTFVLVIAGLLLVLLTPNEIWYEWNWSLVGVFFLWILSSVGFVFSLQTWQVKGSRLRYGGITNLFVIVICGVVGSLDTFSWVLLGASILPGYPTQLLYVMTMIVLFCIYSLYIIQKSLKSRT